MSVEKTAENIHKKQTQQIKKNPILKETLFNNQRKQN